MNIYEPGDGSCPLRW